MTLSADTFDGVTVLDLTQLLPGPFCTMLLADLGARVIKVEPPHGGDWTRWTPPMVVDGPRGYGAFFEALHRGKEGIAIDLKSPFGQDVLERLVNRADVIVEGFRPGVLERLGLDPSALLARRPEAIVARVTGYGGSGERARRAGHDLNFLAYAGVLGATGPAEARPGISGVQIADLAGGALYAAFAIASALFRRERTGRGGVLDIAMAEGALSLAAPALRVAARSTDRAGRGRDLLTGGVPSYDVYETADGRWLAIGALEPVFWARACEVLGCPELVGDGLATGERAEAVREAVAVVVRRRTAHEWRDAFDAVDACVEVVRTLDEVLADEHLRARGAIREVDGAAWVVPPTSGSGPASTPSPRLGEHSRRLLHELGWTDAEVDAAVAAGSVVA